MQLILIIILSLAAYLYAGLLFIYFYGCKRFIDDDDAGKTKDHMRKNYGRIVLILFAAWPIALAAIVCLAAEKIITKIAFRNFK